MTEYNQLLVDPVNNDEININTTTVQSKLFNVDSFIQDVKQESIINNKRILKNAINMNAYDVSNSCIREVVFKLSKTPVKYYAHKWLPITFRAALGKAIHNYIQDISKIFTEQECSMKIPSIRVSTRLDCLINENVIVEIKSLPYRDYKKIYQTNQPRLADFYQAVLYKYLIETHLQEIQNQSRDNLRSDPPKLKKYNINYLQFIYVANDLVSQDTTSISQELKLITTFKKLLNSRYNKFFFIKTIDIDLQSIDISQHTNFIISKINEINRYINSNKIPPKSHKYIEKNCFFCFYNLICKNYK